MTSLSEESKRSASERSERFNYVCLWSKVEGQGIYGVTIDIFPDRSWGMWIPERSVAQTTAKPIYGFDGKKTFSFEDLKVCHYQFADKAQCNDPFYTEEAFGIWELKDGRWIFVWISYCITDWCYNTNFVHSWIADSLARLVRFGLTDYQRSCFGLVLLDREKVLFPMKHLWPVDLSLIIVDYLENYEVQVDRIGSSSAHWKAHKRRLNRQKQKSHWVWRRKK